MMKHQYLYVILLPTVQKEQRVVCAWAPNMTKEDAKPTPSHTCSSYSPSPSVPRQNLRSPSLLSLPKSQVLCVPESDQASGLYPESSSVSHHHRHSPGASLPR